VWIWNCRSIVGSRVVDTDGLAEGVPMRATVMYGAGDVRVEDVPDAT